MAKLYASIRNEKGKKDGLGGNEYLDIDIRVGNSHLASFTLRRGEHPDDPDYETWVLYDNGDEPIYWLDGEPVDKKKIETGKKQKDDLDIAFRRVNADERYL